MNSHPVTLVVTDDLRRSRLTVFFRLLLAIPHFIVVALWGLLAWFGVIANWIVTLIAGTPQASLWSFLVRFLRYYTHVTAYANLIANPFPSFSGDEGTYPIDLHVDGPERQNRWVTGFRIILAIPALLIATVLSYVVGIIFFLGWFVCLALGRMPEGMRNLAAYCLRYQSQTHAYSMILTDRYPTLSAGPGTIEAPAAPQVPGS
jgi:hypothetical protein